ncbi:hypothetical protein GQ457_08G014490 [Hibiscus cannabinus]
MKVWNNNRARCLQRFPLMNMEETPIQGKHRLGKGKRGQPTDSHSLPERVGKKGENKVFARPCSRMPQVT